MRGDLPEKKIKLRVADYVTGTGHADRATAVGERSCFLRATTEGAQVVFGDVLEVEGKTVEAEIRAAGGEATFIRFDVTSERDWEEAVKAAERHYGRLNVLVNNAGIGGGRRIEDTTLAEWEKTMAVNSTGVFLGSPAAIPALRRAGGGSIINISSQLGLVGTDISSPHDQASKGAVRLLTKATAMQYAKEGSRAVTPPTPVPS